MSRILAFTLSRLLFLASSVIKGPDKRCILSRCSVVIVIVASPRCSYMTAGNLFVPGRCKRGRWLGRSVSSFVGSELICRREVFCFDVVISRDISLRCLSKMFQKGAMTGRVASNINNNGRAVKTKRARIGRVTSARDNVTR